MRKLIILLISIAGLQLKAQTITNYTTNDGLISNYVECIHVDADDNIWFGTNAGAQKYDESSSNWTNFNQADYPDMLSNNIKEINSAVNEVWLGSDYGINVWNDPVLSTYTTANGLNSNKVYCIERDGNGDIWVGTDAGVSYYNGSTWASYGSPDIHWSGVSAIGFDSNGDKWLGVPLGHLPPIGGVIHFDGTNFVTYDTSAIISPKTTAIIVDNQDNKWIGTEAGMSVMDASNTSFVDYIEMYTLPPPHDSINPVVDIAMDSHGRIWAAIYVDYLDEGGVAMWDGNQWEDFHVSDGLAGPNVKGLAIDSQDNVWVATSSGVSKISYISSTNNPLKSNFDLYPNPTLGTIYVNALSEKITTISVYNNLGSLVYVDNSISKETIQADLSFLPKGLYYINLSSDKKNKTHKLFIE